MERREITIEIKPRLRMRLEMFLIQAWSYINYDQALAMTERFGERLQRNHKAYFKAKAVHDGL